MSKFNLLLAMSLLVLCAPIAGSADDPPKSATGKTMAWTIDGVKREAVVFAPDAASRQDSPVLFGFHGHGGKASNGAEKFGFQKLWPDAIVVYMQGLPSPGKSDPDGLRNGWQKNAGEQGDRDLKFFDAVLAGLKKDYKVDEKRIYSSGHSNGGGFTYLLWLNRPKTFAAIAPSAGGFRSRGATPDPLPVMHVAGKNDTNVPFENQERTMQRVREINGCKSEATDWSKDCKRYESEKGTPFVSYVHPGTHKYPDEAPPLIVKFFKEQVRK